MPGLAQSPSPTDQTLQSLRRDMDELIKGQIELQKQVQDLKNLLQANQAPAPAQIPKTNFDFDITGAPVDGLAQAPLVMIEFSDFQCPFCARYDKETFPEIERQYVHTSKLRCVFENFPLENIHPTARHLAEAAICISTQRQFWPMRRALFADQATLTSDQAITDFAKRTGVDMAAYEKCRKDPATGKKIDRSVSEASAAGISGAPTFFIGRSEPGENKVKVLKVIVGQQPYETFRQALDGLLAAPQ